MISISKMSGKLEGIPAINTNTLSNKFCIKQNARTDNSICKDCYSVAMLTTFRKNAVPAFQRNSVAISEKIIHPDGLPVVNAAYFRFSCHGEIINNNHFINLINIAVKNPRTNFALWTKRIDIVNKALKDYKKPKNLILVYSNPLTDRIITVPKGFDKVFNNVSSDNGTNCHGKCIDCLKCYKFSKSHKNNVIIEKIK